MRTGEQVEFTAWYSGYGWPDQPDNLMDNEDCLHLTGDPPICENKWSDSYCGHMSMLPLCQKLKK